MSRKFKEPDGILEHYQTMDTDGEVYPITDLTIDELRNELARAYDMIDSFYEFFGGMKDLCEEAQSKLSSFMEG